MKNIEKYKGIIPAFYACYDDRGEVSADAVQALTAHLMRKGVKGLYVGGSSGECIYQSVEDRKRTLESVMETAKGKLTVIAHVACNNTQDSCALAEHAEKLGVDAIAAIPPIYFHLPEHAIAKYWNDISAAAPHTDFIIYNIPQLAGTALTLSLFQEMLKNPRVIGVKNSSMPVQDIQQFKDMAGEGHVVFNGPDEQLISGLAMGADGAIGGTFAVMPELYLKIMELVQAGELKKARAVQYEADRIIYAMCACRGNLYAVMKEIMKRQHGIDAGSVRLPLAPLVAQDLTQVEKCDAMIRAAIAKFA